MEDVLEQIVLCNGGTIPAEATNGSSREPLRLEYRADHPNRLTRLLLPDFVRNVYHLEPRVLDLLEIAAYVFTADRLVTRGRKDAMEYHSWSRHFHFVIKVRDSTFWSTSSAMAKLADCLRFMTGDASYTFTFQPGHSTPPSGLFDSEVFKLEHHKDISVVLFSGGLDSFAGAVERLARSDDVVCLVSHRSGQPGTARTQERLYGALRDRYGDRVTYYRFRCSLSKNRAAEETQRTRAFLYASIAYAICSALSQKAFYVFENGVTALNLLRRQDLINARASRTTHPKTIALLGSLFSEIEGSPVEVLTPFAWKTKADVFSLVAELGRPDLITSTVSCSRTFQHLGLATHCGGCFQCIDRRFAAYASGLDATDDAGIYAKDFVTCTIDAPETRTCLIDYIRQAREFARCSLDQFYIENLDELADITDSVAGATDDEEAVHRIWELCRRHGKQVGWALRRMRDAFDEPFESIPEGSLLAMVTSREYLKEPVERLVNDITTRLLAAIPIAFRKNAPKDEGDLNDKVGALLESYTGDFEREFPAVRFALTDAVPDFSSAKADLFIEAKYVRGATSPSKVRDGIAADLTDYPATTHVLFVVYDPQRAIARDDKFKADFEGKGHCTVCVVR